MSAKTWKLASVVVLTCSLVAGCAEPGGVGPQEVTADRPIFPEETEAERNERLNGVPDEDREDRDQAVTAMSQRLADADRQIAALQSRVEQLADDAREEWEQRMAELRRQRDEVASRIERLRAAAIDAWEDPAMQTRSAYEDLRREIKALSEELEETAENG